MQRFIVTRIGQRKRGREHCPARFYAINDAQIGEVVAYADSYEEAMQTRNYLERQAKSRVFGEQPKPQLTMAGYKAMQDLRNGVINDLATQTDPLTAEQLLALRRLEIPERHYAHLLGGVVAPPSGAPSVEDLGLVVVAEDESSPPGEE